MNSLRDTLFVCNKMLLVKSAAAAVTTDEFTTFLYLTSNEMCLQRCDAVKEFIIAQ